MAHFQRKPGWHLPERSATPESTYWNRRQVLAALGFTAAGAAGLLAPTGGVAQAAPSKSFEESLSGLAKLNAPRNATFKVNNPLTSLEVAGRYNNFYEFSRDKDDVWALAGNLTTQPWSVRVDGLVQQPQTFDVDDLLRTMPIEERIYRLRCVEAWSMVVPWVGFPLRELLKRAGPQAGAKYVKLTTFMRPEEAPSHRQRAWFGQNEPWPYTEGLTLAEATNDLTLLVVGVYGQVLPKQFGAPVRLIVPWKYGFKSIKSIARIELTDTQPPTFWNTLAPQEYGFTSNVNPTVPHPRWSQAFERDIGTRERKPTLLFNGYADHVAGLYKGA
jgi:sulfoxide reductase catalytic subunit YedY